MFELLTPAEMMEIDGGFILTGTMVAAGIGCIGGGVAVGYAIGKIIKHFW